MNVCSINSNNQQQQRDVSGALALNLAQLHGPELGPPVAYRGADGVWRKFGYVLDLLHVNNPAP